jgi:hypothetical protein
MNEDIKTMIQNVRDNNLQSANDVIKKVMEEKLKEKIKLVTESEENEEFYSKSTEKPWRTGGKINHFENWETDGVAELQNLLHDYPQAFDKMYNSNKKFAERMRELGVIKEA